MAKSYCVVEFYSESGESKPVEVVPTNWVDFGKKYVFWPPKSGSAFQSAVKKQHPPSPNWSLHRFTRVLAECGTYAEALKKLKKSEDTSNLESEADVIGGPLQKKPRLRPVKTKRTSTLSTSSDDSSVSSIGGQVSAPSFPSLSLVNANIRAPATTVGSGHLITSGAPSFATVGTSDTTLQDRPDLSSLEEPFDRSDIPEPISIVTPNSESYRTESSPVIDISNSFGDSTIASIATSAEIAELRNYTTEIAGKIFKILETLSDELKEVKAYLHATRPAGFTAKYDFTRIPELPIVTRKQLEEFEEWISLDANKILLKEYFGLIGGHSVEKNARNILKRVFGKPIRQEINFTGKSGKVAFQYLQTYDCLKDGVRVTKSDAKDDELQKAVINWFRNSVNW